VFYRVLLIIAGPVSVVIALMRRAKVVPPRDARRAARELFLSEKVFACECVNDALLHPCTMQRAMPFSRARMQQLKRIESRRALRVESPMDRARESPRCAP